MSCINFLFWLIRMCDLLLRETNWTEIVMNFTEFVINWKLLNALILLTVITGFLWSILIGFFMMHSKSVIILIIRTWIDYVRYELINWDKFWLSYYLIVDGGPHFYNIVIFLIVLTCIPMIAWSLTMEPWFWLLFLNLRVLD